MSHAKSSLDWSGDLSDNLSMVRKPIENDCNIWFQTFVHKLDNNHALLFESTQNLPILMSVYRR